jgi:hypothetical protein
MTSTTIFRHDPPLRVKHANGPVKKPKVLGPQPNVLTLPQQQQFQQQQLQLVQQQQLLLQQQQKLQKQQQATVVSLKI